jgi:hypothetical protein
MMAVVVVKIDTSSTITIVVVVVVVVLVVVVGRVFLEASLNHIRRDHCFRRFR